jgi:hypothetical protein
MSASHIFLPPKQGNRQEFLSSGTFVVPEGVTHVTVIGCGGGGGGYVDSGGDGAGLGIKSVSVTPGASIPVTIGAGGVPNVTISNCKGGDSSFGSVLFVGARNVADESLVRRLGYARGGDLTSVVLLETVAQGNHEFDGGGSGGGGAGPFGDGGASSTSAAANSGAGGGQGVNIGTAGSGGSGRIIVVW